MRGPRPGARHRPCVAGLPAILAVLAACSSGYGSPGAGNRTGGVLQVVAAESFWGSIASQIGGVHAAVVSIISNPNVDPHSYEPTPADARALAQAQLVIENGIGYDPWIDRINASEGGTVAVLSAGAVLRRTEGDNPHVWYDPTDVLRMAAAITAEYSSLDPAYATYFANRERRLTAVALVPYERLISRITARYAGTPVGASESIFSMLAPALGLRVLTPSSFLKAISEGTDVSAADKATIDAQIRSHAIRIYVYNSQNATPDVQVQLDECRAQGIPVATITETLTPPGDTFEQWQVRQLVGIEAALATADRATAALEKAGLATAATR